MLSLCLTPPADVPSSKTWEPPNPADCGHTRKLPLVNVSLLTSLSTAWTKKAQKKTEVVVSALLPELNVSVLSTLYFRLSFTLSLKPEDLSPCLQEKAITRLHYTYSLLRASRPRKAPGSTVLIKLFFRSLEKRDRERKSQRRQLSQWLLSIYISVCLSVCLAVCLSIYWHDVVVRHSFWDEIHFTDHACWPYKPTPSKETWFIHNEDVYIVHTVERSSQNNSLLALGNKGKDSRKSAVLFKDSFKQYHMWPKAFQVAT